MDWERANEAYLSSALAWVRLRLERRIQAESATILPPGSAAPSGPEQPEVRRRRFRPPPMMEALSPPPPLPALDPPGRAGRIRDEVERAATLMAEAAAVQPPPAFMLLAQRFDLTDFERDVLLLCVAAELDPSLPALCGRAQGDPRLSHPTFALAFDLFDDPTWKPLLPDHPLRHFSLIEIYQPPGTPLTTSALRADERVVSYVKGVSYVDDRLTPLLVSLDELGASGSPPPSQATVVERIVRDLARTDPAEPLPVVQLIGADPPSKQLIAWRAADMLGLRLYRLPSELLPGDAAELERLTRLWRRESILVPIALYLDAEDDGPWERQLLPVTRFLARSGGVVFLDTREVLPTYGRPSLALDVAQPTAAEQAAAWSRALGPEAGDAPPRLAAQFDLGAPTIERIARAARAQPGQRPLADRAWAISLVETRKGLDALAERIDPKATWDDIILPPAELQLLRRIAAQVGQRGLVYDAWGFAEKTSRGLGINALFAGPSGTGKTMAAEVIANHLRLNLFRIDLSAVVSKYIGETEKNLARMFREAESGGVVLFFDEADALFGKRTEIRDSHDRYANIEINYLLQRMEAYRGLAILATNMRSALDPAFVRRLRFVVTFPYPSPAERRRIWEKVFPQAARIEQLDLDRLANLNFTGGNIFTVAINAAFMAAQDGTPVAMRHVLEAARAETRKLERPVNEREFELREQAVGT
jgi:ATPase family associated with various cellular activities (AAA)